MPPLILHNVPDDELYVGEDGIQRPYAMLFPSNEASLRNRRMVPETGSFGKSTRRSRSRTGTPAPAKAVDPTIEAGHAIFSDFANRLPATETTPRKATLTTSFSQSITPQTDTLVTTEKTTEKSATYLRKEPTEVVLRGFPSHHQYAAIYEFERIGGRICEDYPRDPPIEYRRYKSDLRDPATQRIHPLSKEERKKAMQFAGGKHWIKVTFESAEAAETAIQNSPQVVQGYMISAEAYRGVPPTADEAVPVGSFRSTSHRDRTQGRKASATIPRTYTSSALLHASDLSEASSARSSSTLDTTTLGSNHTYVSSSTLTMTGQQQQQQPVSPTEADSEPASPSCKVFTYAKPMTLLPAEQALLPQKSVTQRVLALIPLVSWFSGDVIGASMPKTENGEVDWNKVSMYWIVVAWLQSWLRLLGLVGEGDKEE